MVDLGNGFVYKRISETASGHPIEHRDELYMQLNCHLLSNTNPYINSGEDLQVTFFTQTFKPRILAEPVPLGEL